jgi:hypothetical protein
VAESTGQPGFADPHRAADQQMLAVPDPLAGGELLEQRPVEPTRRAQIGVLDHSILAQAGLHDRESAVDAFIQTHQTKEAAVQADPAIGKKAFNRLRAATVHDTLGRHISALDPAIAADSNLSRDTAKGAEAAARLAKLRADARAAAGRMPMVSSPQPRSSPGASF